MSKYTTNRENFYRAALHELMLMSGYVPNREEMEDTPPDVDAFIDWHRRNCAPPGALDASQRELQRVRKALGIEPGIEIDQRIKELLAEQDRVRSEQALPGPQEALTWYQYIRALQVGRVVCVETTYDGGKIVTKTLFKMKAGLVETREWGDLGWEPSETIPFGNPSVRKIYILEDVEISCEGALLLLEQHCLSFPRTGSPVAFREWIEPRPTDHNGPGVRTCRAYLTDAEIRVGEQACPHVRPWPVVRLFEQTATATEKYLGCRGLSSDDLKAKWVTLDPESERARRVSEAAKEAPGKRSPGDGPGELSLAH